MSDLSSRLYKVDIRWDKAKTKTIRSNRRGNFFVVMTFFLRKLRKRGKGLSCVIMGKKKKRTLNLTITEAFFIPFFFFFCLIHLFAQIKGEEDSHHVSFLTKFFSFRQRAEIQFGRLRWSNSKIQSFLVCLLLQQRMQIVFDSVM